MRRLLASVLCLFLGGCTFSAPQLEAVLSMARGGQEVGIEAELVALAWRLEWLGEESTVYPVVEDGIVLFTNASEVQVVFDGWQVTAVARLLPMGRSARIEVSVDRTSMRFLEAGVLIREVSCEPWAQVPDGDGVLWTQSCDGMDESNTIYVDGAGQTTRLRFVIHPAYPPIRLVKGTLA